MKIKKIFIITVILVLLMSLFVACSGNIDKEFDPDSYYKELESIKKEIRKKTDFVPEIVIVLGSGLGDFADNIEVVAKFNYSEIKGFPVSQAAGHDNTLIFGKVAGKNVACMKGRIHYYEGYSMEDVVKPLRVLKLLGAKSLILTNAVGAINTDYKVGDFVAIRDQISSFVPSPLIGENITQLGDRFVDMTNVYDKKLTTKILEIGKENDFTVHSGVFLQVTGPQYETPTEIKMYRNLGADTIGMSTAVEAIAARHMGMKICGISTVSNMAAGIEEGELSSEDINDVVSAVAENFKKLLIELLNKWED